PEECGCLTCRNYAAARAQALPQRVLELLTQLGIDPKLAGEVYCYGRSRRGLYGYGGWYHFVGRIEAGDDAWKKAGKPEDEYHTADYVKVGNVTEIGFSSRHAPPLGEFADRSWSKYRSRPRSPGCWRSPTTGLTSTPGG
ncbi:MAG: hypothetical protein ACE10D_03495, partial [Planctomycetota bacterium]